MPQRLKPGVPKTREDWDPDVARISDRYLYAQTLGSQNQLTEVIKPLPAQWFCTKIHQEIIPYYC